MHRSQRIWEDSQFIKETRSILVECVSNTKTDVHLASLTIILGESLLEVKVPQSFLFLQKSSRFTLEGGSFKIVLREKKNCLSVLNELNYLGTAQVLLKHFNTFNLSELIFL